MTLPYWLNLSEAQVMNRLTRQPKRTFLTSLIVLVPFVTSFSKPDTSVSGGMALRPTRSNHIQTKRLYSFYASLLDSTLNCARM